MISVGRKGTLPISLTSAADQQGAFSWQGQGTLRGGGNVQALFEAPFSFMFVVILFCSITERGVKVGEDGK